MSDNALLRPTIASLRARALCVALLAGCVSHAASADDWSTYRGPRYDGVSSETAWSHDFPDGKPRVAWRRELGPGAASFVVQGQRAITMGHAKDHDIVYCLNVEDGTPLWEFRYPCPFAKRQFEGGPAATPTIDGDLVYALSHEGHLHAISLKDGSLVWKAHLVADFGGRPAQWFYAGSPLATDKVLIVDVGGKGNSTVALDKRTGRKVWGAGDDMPGYAQAVPAKTAGKDALLVFKAKAMVAKDAADGAELWRIPWESAYDVNASTPLVAGTRMLLSSGYGSGRAALFDISGATPRELWRNPNMKTKMSTCVLIGDRVYGITEKDGTLLCLNAETGEAAWSQPGMGKFGTLTAAGDRLVILTESGELVIARANPERFEGLARDKVLQDRCWVQPILANGRIFMRTNKGSAACVDVRP